MSFWCWLIANHKRTLASFGVITAHLMTLARHIQIRSASDLLNVRNKLVNVQYSSLLGETRERVAGGLRGVNSWRDL